MSALTFAAANGSVRSAAVLLENGADVETRDERGLTPLMVAAMSGYPEVIDFLLQHGADLDATGRGGVTARTLAAEKNLNAIVKLLDDRKTALSAQKKSAADEAKVPAGPANP